MLSNDLLNAVFNGANYTSPTNLYLALFTQAGEVVGGSYERVEVTGMFQPASNGMTSNSVQIRFPTPSLDWGLVNRVAIFDVLTGGEPLLYSELEQDFAISNGSSVFLNAGLLQFGVTV